MEIKVNDITLYYEKKGFGKPLIMLHGNGESHEIYDVLCDALKDTFELYLIDSRCHGKSDRNVEISYDLMASDVKCFMDQLELKEPSLFGFSDGGIVGLLLAIRYPDLLSHLIIAGVNLSPEALNREVLEDMKSIYEKTKDPLYYMMIHEPHITAEDLSYIKSKTFIMVGSHDVIPLSHSMMIHRSIMHSEIYIFEGFHHEDYIIHQSIIASHIINFAKK